MVDPTVGHDKVPFGSTTDDVSVMARIAGGDPRALALVYDTYGVVVYRLAVAITQKPAAAEQVVADAFGVLWREARGIMNDTSVFGWLSSTVRAAALARRGPVPTTPGGAAETAWRVADALGELSPLQRQSVELAYFGGLTRGDIARRLGETELRVSVALRTGMEFLRDVLRPASAHPSPRLVASL
jgi:RNA polymerase sigma-70 factor (ECF subfamily)